MSIVQPLMVSAAVVLFVFGICSERRYFEIAEQQARELGWTRVSRAARWHIASRIHAASVLPAALRTGGRAPVAALAEHVLRPLPRHGAPR